MNQPRLFIVAPVFNEEKSLPALLETFGEISENLAGEMDVEIILSDDASTDNTVETAKAWKNNPPVTVVEHVENKGPGHAFGSAFAHLAGRVTDDDWVLTMEGDNTSDPGIISQMFTRTKEGYEVILASPYMYGGGITQTTALRVFLSRMANTFVKDALGVSGIMTVSSFFRLVKGSVLLRLQREYGPRIVERNGFESMLEMLMKMIFLNIPISEVPMVLDTSKRQGKSKMKITRTIIGYLTLARDRRRWEKTAAARSGR